MFNVNVPWAELGEMSPKVIDAQRGTLDFPSLLTALSPQGPDNAWCLYTQIQTAHLARTKVRPSGLLMVLGLCLALQVMQSTCSSESMPSTQAISIGQCMLHLMAPYLHYGPCCLLEAVVLVPLPQCLSFQQDRGDLLLCRWTRRCLISATQGFCSMYGS